MRGLPLFRFGRRARSTSLGIALCTMFIVASFSVVSGIRASTENLRDNFEPDYFLLAKPTQQGLSFFAVSDLGDVSGKTALGTFVECHVAPISESLTVFSIKDPSHVLKETLTEPSDTDVLVGTDLNLPMNITLGSTLATVIGKFSSSIFSPLWILGSSTLVGGLAGDDGSNFALSKGLSDIEISTLEKLGFSVTPMTGIVQFLDSGINEIENDALWVLVPSAFVIGVLAYSFIGSETADRRHEIGIVKTIGAGRRRVMWYLLADAAIICAWGGLLGVAFGIILSYGISTAASSAFSSVFIVRAPATLILAAYACTVLAGVAGALLPAAKMTLSSPVADLKEVTP